MDLKQLHYDVMAGKTDYIPLIINIDREDAIAVSSWEATFNPQKFAEAAAHNRSLELEFPTDRIVTIESNFTETLIPCMFGAVPCEMPGGNIYSRTIVDSLDEAEELEIDIEPLKRAEAHLKIVKANVPDNLNVAITRFMSPLDNAVNIRGTDFYMDLYLEPERSRDFLNRIAVVTIYALKYLKNAVDEDYKEHITSNRRGIYIKGTRLSSDSIVTLSPKMLEDFILPLFKMFHVELGGLFVHYCTTPFPSGHVLPVFAKNPGIVDGMDNWQGYKSFFNDKMDGVLQDKVSMSFDVEFEQAYDIENLMRQPLFSDVKRDGGRGIFVSTQTKSLEDAKRLYDRWQEFFIKH